MKQRSIPLLAFKISLIFLAALFISSVPVKADVYKSVNASKNGKVDGTTFSTSMNSDQKSLSLYAKKAGRKIRITKKLYNSWIHTNGNIVYYLIKNTNTIGLRKKSLTSGKVKKISNLSITGTGLDLRLVKGKYAYFVLSQNVKKIGDPVILRRLRLDTGKTSKFASFSAPYMSPYIDLIEIYNGQLYFKQPTYGGPEGDLMRINLNTKAKKKVDTKDHYVTSADYIGNGLFLTEDGSGAGSSYLGLYDANKDKFKVVTKCPEGIPKVTSKYIYYISNIGGTLSVAGPFTVAVARYNISTGKRETLVKSLYIGGSITKFTTKYIRYTDSIYNGKTITKKW